MKLIIDTEEQTLTYQGTEQKLVFSLFSKEAFELISEHWLKLGWHLKYAYQFTWLGRPIIQLPDDLIRIQEILFTLQPDVIIETGVAYGGSMFFYASLCKILGKGKVIGIEKLLRPQNREAIADGPFSSLITLIEGDSIHPKTIERVKRHIKKEDSVLVILDSNHSKHHVLKELELYSSFVTPGSYIIATDGLMKELHDAPHGKEDWLWDNPHSAICEFIQSHPEFERISSPAPIFNKSKISNNVSQCKECWLKRINI